MEILSYILSLIGLVSMITASLIKGKRMKTILFLVSLANILVATSYLLDGSGINGAATCYFGGIITLVNFFFESKDKPVPKWLIVIYAILLTALNIVVAGGVSALGSLVIIASLTFLMCIGQKNGAKYRFWTLVNMSLWCTYDILSASYSVLVSHVLQLIFVVVGMILHDRKNKKGA